VGYFVQAAIRDVKTESGVGGNTVCTMPFIYGAVAAAAEVK